MSELLTPPDDEVVIERDGALVILRLNRPKALNSLTLGMVRALSAALDRFETDDTVRALLLEGAGERGLCAGGDIRVIYDSGKAGTDEAAMFWREEYRLDARIARYPKPYISVIDGITMGGGVGVSIHARYRIVTERTKFAMPEVGIGFMPDIGGTWFLSRTPDQLGLYLGLTANTVGAGDVMAAGLAELFVPTADLPALKAKLAAVKSAGGVKDALFAFAKAPPASVIAANRALIARAFVNEKVEDILKVLDEDGSPFAQETAKAMRLRSPTSLKLARRMLVLGKASASLEECLVREYWAVTGLLSGHDFYEGVRAAVIDKDRNPRWSPASLAEVEDATIEALIKPNKHPALTL